MKLFLASMIALIFSYPDCYSQANTISPDKILSLYWSPKKDAKIQIYKKGEMYFGNFQWMATPRKDTKNPDQSLQQRNILGLEFLSGFSYSNNEYTGGKIYDPKSGKTYDCKMFLKADDLQVRGYIGLSIFGRTEVFERVK